MKFVNLENGNLEKQKFGIMETQNIENVEKMKFRKMEIL